MSQKTVIALVVFSMTCGVAALAAPAPHAFDAYVRKVAEETGRKEDDVRDEAIQSLRREGKFSEQDLERIGRNHDERAIDERVEVNMVHDLAKIERMPIDAVLDAFQQPKIMIAAANAFDAMKVAGDTASKLDEERFIELPEQAVRKNLRDVIDSDPQLVKLSHDLKEQLINALMDGRNVRVPAAELIKGIELAANATNEGNVELSKPLKTQWIDFVLGGKPAAVYSKVEGRFTLRAIPRDFPPYGMTFMGQLEIDGKTVSITDKDLIKATFDEAGDKRPARVRVLTGTFKAERIAREVPPYGMIETFEFIVEKPAPRAMPKLEARAGGANGATAAARSNRLISTLRTATHPALDAFRKLAEKATKGERNDSAGTVTTAYRIKDGNEPRAGETQADMIERIARYSLHRDFPITGDEDGYSFERLEKNVSADQLDRETRHMTWLFSDDSTVDAAKVKALLLKAAHSGLIVMLGGGSGNNTMADIVIVADPKNMEFVILLNSNFGSDS